MSENNKFAGLLAVLIVFALVLVGGYIAYDRGLLNGALEAVGVPLPQENEPVAVVEKSAKPFGFLVMNLESSDENSSGLFTYDFENKTFSSSPYPYLMPTISADESRMLGSGITLESKGSDAAVLMAKADILGDTILYASTTQTTPFWNTRIAPSGEKYTFEVAPKEGVNDPAYFIPSNWQIYLSDSINGTPYFVAHGHGAHFSPDESQILYMADNGLRTYDVVTKEDTLVLPLQADQVSTYLMSDVSPDGTLLAVTDPFRKLLILGSITSWKPFEVSSPREFEVQAFWPKFSPDSQWLAFESVEWDFAKNTEATNRKLEVLHVESGSISEETDLSEYPQSSITISDWIRNK